jgi:hypothetical protein
MGFLENFSNAREVSGRVILSPPLLFVLAAELLQILVNQAASHDLIQAPIAQPMVDFSIVQYADDTLLIMKAHAQQLIFLKSLLNCFADSTCLRVNYRKSRCSQSMSQKNFKDLL